MKRNNMPKEKAMLSKTHLLDIFGEECVSSEAKLLDAYASDMSFMPSIRPYCVVRPMNSDQIGRLVEKAMESRTPLVPVSSGPPHFRGDTVPGIGNALIVDMSQMKKILHIDRKHRVAMFEPGVTFGELSRAVAKEGLRLNMPLLPRATKSVVGSLLEREPVLMPKYHWDIADPLACSEIFFGNGEMFRTGAAAGSGSIEEQWAAGGAQKEAAGPSAASWYRIIQGAQGTMGIVTWVSARCELLPTLQAPYFVADDRLDKLLDAVHWLIRLRLVNECLVLNSIDLAQMMPGNDADAHQRDLTNLPSWVLFFNIAAYELLPEERLQGQIHDMVDLTQRLGLEAVAFLEGLSAEDFLSTIQAPCAEPFWKLQRRGGCQDIFFLTTLDRLPEMIRTMTEAVDEAGHSRDDMGVYIQPIVQGVNCHCEFSLFYDSQDKMALDRTRVLTETSIRKLSANGAFFSRPYGPSTGYIVNRDAATRSVLNRVKDIADPKHIMNPGKLGY